MKKLVTTITALALAVTTASTAFAEVTPLRYDNTGYVYYCVGNGWKGEDYIDTTKEAQTVQTYINSWGYFCDKYGCIKNPKAKDITEGRLNSPIVYLAGHGNYYSVDCGNSGIKSADRTDPFVNISNFKFNSVDLAFLAACKTNSIANSITKKFVDNGAKYAIGWVGSPETAHMLAFAKAYFQALDEGKTFGDAELEARKYLIKHATSGDETAAIYTYRSEGDKNAKPDINYARSRNNSSTLDYLLKQLEDDEPRWIVNDDVKYKNGSKDYDQINEYIKNNVNPNFNISNYAVNEYEFDFTTSEKITSLFFIYMLGDIRSDFGYEVDFDENGNALLITQIGTDLSTYKPTGEEKTDEDTAAILKMARDKIENKQNIESQKLTKRFDSKTKKVIYKVNTIVGSDDTGYDNVVFEYIP